MPGLLSRMLSGAVAGLVGTVAMDAVWYARYRAGGGESGPLSWELATTTSFEEASAPGQVGKRIADTIGVDLPDQAAGTTTNVVHVLTGVGYGIGHALTQHHKGALSGGVSTGVGAFLNSYSTLGALGIYEPMWTYDTETLKQDLTAHLAFGLATGLAYRVLAHRILTGRRTE